MSLDSKSQNYIPPLAARVHLRTDRAGPGAQGGQGRDVEHNQPHCGLTACHATDSETQFGAEDTRMDA